MADNLRVIQINNVNDPEKYKRYKSWDWTSGIAKVEEVPRSSSSNFHRRMGVTECQGIQPHIPRLVSPPVPPFDKSDLHPVTGAGMYPPRISGIDGGMLLGPNDPRWLREVGEEQSSFPRGAPGAPPGARFDPYGPPGVPVFETNRFSRLTWRPGRNTHPDLEHFRDGSDLSFSTTKAFPGWF